MKNFFGYRNEETDILYGENYLDRKISEEATKAIEDKQDEVTEYNKKVNIPVWMSIVMYLTFSYGIIVLSSFIGALGENSISEIITNGKYLLITGGISLVIAVGIFIYSLVKRKTGVTKEESDELTKEIDEVAEMCKAELNIPKDVKEINVLMSLDSKDKNGVVKKTNYMPLNASLFFEEESICFAFIDTVYKVPKNDIISINKNKKITFIGWNKSDQPKNNKYQGHKVVVQSGVYYTTMTYSVTVDTGFDTLQIIVPCYDIQTLADLLEMEIKEEE